MKRKKVMIALVALALAVSGGSVISGKVHAASSETYKASPNFSQTTQGNSNWYYQQSVTLQYSDLQYDKNQKRWSTSSGFPWVSASAQYPSAQSDAVRKWVAPSTGIVEITGIVKKSGNKGDGIIASISKDNTVLWSSLITTKTGEKPKNVDRISVQAGTAIYFSVNKNGTTEDDETLWNPSISFTPTTTVPVEVAVPPTTSQPVVSIPVEEKPVNNVEIPQSSVTPVITGLSVTDFGAVANDGKDDYAAFVAAIKAAKEQKKTLSIPAGEFSLSKILKIDGITVVGAGKESTVLVSTDPNGGSIDLSGDGVQLRNLTHTYQTTVPRGNGSHDKNSITVRGATNFVIDNVRVNKSSTAGIMMAYGSNNGVVSNNTVENTNADGIHMTTESHHITVENNTVMGVGDDGIAVVSYDTSPSPVNNIKIRGNQIGNFSKARGISVVGGTDVWIENNKVADTMMAGVYISVEGSYNTLNVDRVKVVNNTIHNTGIQSPQNHPNVLVYAGKGNIDHIEFIGNMITDGAHRGIGIWGDGTIKAVKFERNTLINKNGAATTFKNGIITLVDNIGF
ncbi:right-handed parallel beta-helix repeat-containing protein [Saccharibacillus sp. JS10]|uniref:right-handed parallel beta-helix repeat-containing protein n=1 Tax=Saccharibacillus sp. JS10 TaxID=2950552 RepID=UPI00210AE85D|nr:right-handed parallel beta-helix repeat-containing protein [Saccharibacillus sp. JS10]MCQ4086305.1 right-handed parallel beta-helix repeat-containing protein [Saccharibacillus sp. JS10]